jgi:prepilin-type processing-associated H-X9-DG protein
MKLLRYSSSCFRRLGNAFTVLELVVVIGLLAALALMLIPVITATRPNVLGLQCMNNSKRLAVAWHMYADDNRDLLVYARDDGSGTGNPLNAFVWACSGSPLDPHNPCSTTDTNADMVRRPLWAYTGRDATCYICPAEHAGVVINGIFTPYIRTYCMNLYLGGYAGTAPAVTQRLFLKLADLTSPGPAKTFVFLDGRVSSINGSSFYTDMTGFPNQPSLYRFTTDLPEVSHNFGCGFSFADGHSTVHSWTDPRTYAPTGSLGSYASPGNQDVAWLQDHATRPK